MLKQFFMARNTQRDNTELYREDNREEGVRGDQEDKRGSQKEREHSSW